MMRIAKISTSGMVNYLTKTVTHSLGEYLRGKGESPGYWLGPGAGDLGLAGEVNTRQLETVLEGVDPRTGTDLLKLRRENRVRGFDLTFSLPKSLSVIYGLGEKDVAAAIRRAHLAGVSSALEYLNEFAGYARRGTDGVTRMETAGFTAAVFTHRISRAGDPQLHSHVIVPNLIKGVDGQYSALDGSLLYSHARAASGLYRARVRHELAELGLTWEFADNGLAEATAVPKAVRDEFSRRRRDIEQAVARHSGQLAAAGLSPVEAAQFLARETRPRKVTGISEETLADLWRERADTLDFDREAIAAALAEGRQFPPAPIELSEAAERLFAPTGLTAEEATFTPSELLAKLADQLPQGVASTAELLELAEQLLTDERVVRLSTKEQQLRTGKAASQPQYTTREMLHLEQCLVDSALSRLSQGAGVVPEALVTAEIAKRPSLGQDQIDMIRQLTRQGDGLSVVHALAGAGKTRGLEAACAAWQKAGFVVTGAAVSRRAATILADKAGIPTTSLARLLLDIKHPDGAPTAASVVVIDEGGMASTRQIAEVEAACAAAGALLVLTGDSKQLPEIEVGGGYRSLVTRLPSMTLTENRRQHDPDERARLVQLRTGSPKQAMLSYEQAGLVISSDTYDDALTEVAKRYLADYTAGRDTVMLALSRETVRDLNTAARDRMAAAGLLNGPTLTVGEHAFQAGDQVLTRVNDTGLGVLNQERWTVTAVDTEAGSLVITGERGQRVLPESYLHRRSSTGEAGLTPAYAITTHVGQGSDVPYPHIFASPGAFRELGYTAASRASEGPPQWYVVKQSVAELECEPHQHNPEPSEPLMRLTRALSISHAKTAAIDTGTPVGHPTVSPLAARQVSRLSQTELEQSAAALASELAATGPPPVDGLLALTRARAAATRRQLAEALADTELAREQLAGIPRLRRRGIKEATATVLLREERVSGLSAEADELDRSVGELEEAAERRADWELAHEPDRERLELLTDEIERREGLNRSPAEDLPPDYGISV